MGEENGVLLRSADGVGTFGVRRSPFTGGVRRSGRWVVFQT
jgi:hypothetical protein